MLTLTIKDIARLAGVSRSAVSRVLNEQSGVRPEVRNAVQKVIDDAGYAPKAAARQLVTRATRAIGLIISDNACTIFGNPIFAAIGKGVSEVCLQKRYLSMLFLGRQDMDEQTLLMLLRGRLFDGIIIISSERDDPSLLLLQETGIPYVRIGHDPDREDLSYVDVDNNEAARRAVHHLISLGHRRIAHITGSPKDFCSHERYEGYKRALVEAGISPDVNLVAEGDWSVECGYQMTKRFLDLPSPPTGLFSANDMMVSGVIQAVQERGLKVPADLAIVGFDDLPQTTMIFPPLTTIRQPCVQMGICAAELLIAQLEKKVVSTPRIILPTELIIRASCGARHT
jgi:LacI family transcriptional regulator